MFRGAGSGSRALRKEGEIRKPGRVVHERLWECVGPSCLPQYLLKFMRPFHPWLICSAKVGDFPGGMIPGIGFRKARERGDFIGFGWSMLYRFVLDRWGHYWVHILHIIFSLVLGVCS